MTMGTYARFTPKNLVICKAWNFTFLKSSSDILIVLFLYFLADGFCLIRLASEISATFYNFCLQIIIPAVDPP